MTSLKWYAIGLIIGEVKQMELMTAKSQPSLIFLHPIVRLGMLP